MRYDSALILAALAEAPTRDLPPEVQAALIPVHDAIQTLTEIVAASGPFDPETGFSAHLSADYTTVGIVKFDNESAPFHDDDTNYDPTTGLYTCPTTRKYFVNVNCSIKNNVGASANSAWEVHVNGVTIIPTVNVATDDGISGHFSFGAFLNLTAGDTVGVYCSTTAGNFPVVAGSTFTIG